jgi:hypothetical protein
MAKPTVQSQVYANPGAGRLPQSYDNQSTALYGEQLQVGRPKVITDDNTDSFSNRGGLVAQVSTITIGTAAIVAYNAIFSIGLADVAVNVTVTPAIGDTAAIIQGKLLTALRSSVAGRYINFASVLATITCTAKDTGTNGGFNLAVSGGGVGYVVAETTPPADPKPIRYGRLLVAVPGEQSSPTQGQPNMPIRNARYARTAAELEFLIGISLRSESNGENFFGGYAQVPAIPPGKPGVYLLRGEIAIQGGPVAILPGGAIHVYLDVAGVDDERVGTLTGAADGALTAQIPTASLVKLRAVYGVPVNTPVYVEIV